MPLLNAHLIILICFSWLLFTWTCCFIGNWRWLRQLKTTFAFQVFQSKQATQWELVALHSSGRRRKALSSLHHIQSLHSPLAKSRKLSHPTASSAPSSDHSLTSFTTSPFPSSSTTLPPITSTSSLPHLPTLLGPFTGYSKAVFLPVFGSLLTSVATMPLVTTNGLTIPLA